MTKIETMNKMSVLLLELETELNKSNHKNVELRLLISGIKNDIEFMSRYKLADKICLLILLEVEKKIEDLTKVDDDKKNIPFYRAPLS